MAMPDTPPYLKDTDFIITKGVDTITISRSPEFTNTFGVVKNRVFINRGNSIISFRDTKWPKYTRLKFELYPLTKTEAETLETFFYNHVGELVTVTLANNFEYEGIFIDPKITVIDEFDDDCNRRVAFEFETEDTV